MAGKTFGYRYSKLWGTKPWPKLPNSKSNYAQHRYVHLMDGGVGDAEFLDDAVRIVKRGGNPDSLSGSPGRVAPPRRHREARLGNGFLASRD